MSDAQTVYRGEWRLPADSTNRQPGSLVIEADGSCVLELIHAFPTMEYVAQEGTNSESISPIDTYPVIHGQAGGSQAFALIDGRTRSIKDNVLSEGREHNISVQRALVGRYWLDNSSEAVFTGMRVDSPAPAAQTANRTGQYSVLRSSRCSSLENLGRIS